MATFRVGVNPKTVIITIRYCDAAPRQWASYILKYKFIFDILVTNSIFFLRKSHT